MTGLYAEVIGDPIAQSKSPMIHRFWLGKLGIEADYSACRVRPDELEDYIGRRREDPLWQGCNVTMPHKIAILDHVTDPGNVRASIGAVNTVIRQNGVLMGTNTDAAGFMAPILDLPLEGAPVVIVGTGGAAQAVFFALRQIGAGPVTILARNALKGAALLARFGLKGDVKGLNAVLPPVSLVVNASALGMAGQLPLELDLSTLPEGALVYDLVYSPLETGLLKAARERGLETVDGLDMLIGQAALAFEMFFGAPVPADCDDELRALLIS